jgi:hypothetical protein
LSPREAETAAEELLRLMGAPPEKTAPHKNSDDSVNALMEKLSAALLYLIDA